MYVRENIINAVSHIITFVFRIILNTSLCFSVTRIFAVEYVCRYCLQYQRTNTKNLWPDRKILEFTKFQSLFKSYLAPT